MINRASTDPSRKLDLFLRMNRAGSISFVVNTSDGNPFSLIYEDFELFIKRFSGDRKDVFRLSLGSGLSISGNVLTASFTSSQLNVDEEGEYYWELYRPDTERTWLSGNAFFHNGVFDNDTESETLVIDNSGTSVYVTISDSGSSGGGTVILPDGIVVFCGEWNLSSNSVPTTGGTGTGGEIKKGNQFYIRVGSSVLVGPDGGPITSGFIAQALDDSPGTSLANRVKWALIQTIV